jgi:predicted HD phosphohydrolase
MDDAMDIQAQIQSHLDKNGLLTCKAAHVMADKLDMDPLFVGDQATASGVRITRCQLGFFGYAEKKGMPGYKIVQKLDHVPETAASAVRRAAEDGKISCATLWEIGHAQNISKRDMGNIVETLGIKTRPCQLGCF